MEHDSNMQKGTTRRKSPAGLSSTLLRGLDVLEAFKKDDSGALSLGDTARLVGLSKSTTHRLLATLELKEYVRRGPHPGEYRLGLKSWEIGVRAVEQLDIRIAAKTPLAKLAVSADETAHLAVLVGHDVVFIDKIESPRPVKAGTFVGSRAPAYCVATGKAILAYQPPYVVEGIIRGGLRSFTPKTVTDPQKLWKKLEIIRSQGFALNREEWNLDVCGVAAPIWNAKTEVVGSISVTIPTWRFTNRNVKRFIQLVKLAAEQASVEMGYLRRKLRIAAGEESGREV